MSKLQNNKSVIDCMVAAFDLDREIVTQKLKQQIHSQEFVLKFSNYSKVKTQNLGDLKRKGWSKKGPVMRQMTFASFVKLYKKGEYFIKMNDRLVYIKDGFLKIGTAKPKDKIEQVIKLNR